MKKLLSVFLCTVLTAGLFSAAVFADETDPGSIPAEEEQQEDQPVMTEGVFEYKVIEGNAAITAYRGSDADVVIPETIGGYPVTGIDYFAFYGCRTLTSVTIPEGVKDIGNHAFNRCSSLTKVTIPEGVTSIGEWAFFGCSSLASVTIPGSVTSIGKNAFAACDLDTIQIHENNPVFDSRDNCNAIIETGSNCLIVGCKSTVVPTSVTGIGDNAFENCKGLKSMTIPGSVTDIGDSAFYGCTSLTSVTIPKNCKKGTYKITVKAAGNDNYKAGKKTVSITVK